MGTYNPDHPYVVGMQWPPLVIDQVLLDSSSEVGYTFRSQTGYSLTSGINKVRVRSTVPPPGQPNRKELVVNLYPADRINGTGPIRKQVIVCNNGSLVAGASLQGGAATAWDAVQNASDGRYIQLSGPNASARFQFDTDGGKALQALQYRRILDVTVLYAVSGPFGELPNGLTLGLERTAPALNWIMDSALTGPTVQTSNVTTRRSRLGELNPWWSTTQSPAQTTTRLPWVLTGNTGALLPSLGLRDLSNNSTNKVYVRLSTDAAVPAGKLFQIHYLALEVTYCEENRIAGGGVDISGGIFLDPDGVYRYDVPIADVGSLGYDAVLQQGEEYALTVGQAYSGAVSVASAVPIAIDRAGTLEEFPTHRGVVLRKTLRRGALPQLETTTLMPALTMVTRSGVPTASDPSSQAYIAATVASLYNRYNDDQNQMRITPNTSGTFPWVRFYARRFPGTNEPLVVRPTLAAGPYTQLAPAVELTPDELDALPELINGWREVTLRLDTPLVIAPADLLTKIAWRFSSPADQQSPWQVLGADDNPYGANITVDVYAGYGGSTEWASIDGVSDSSADLVVSFAREMDTVTGLAVTQQVQPLAVVDQECVQPADAIPTGIHFHRLSWEPVNSPVVAGWGWYEIQRRDTTMPTDVWETIGQITVPHATGMDDYEARVGVESRYRVRMVHRSGIAGPWSPEVAVTIPIPGVTGPRTDVGVLILTSNQDPAANLAYVNVTARDEPEEFTFPEGGQTDLQQMYNRDFRVAFRPTERVGVEFTRTLMINAVGVPPATLDRGFTGLRDLAWDALPYVCVRDELDNRWLATVLVPTGTVQRVRGRGHLELARATVIQVTDLPAPVDQPAPCEGLAVVGNLNKVTASTPAPAVITGRTVQTDSFGRDVAGTWGPTEQGGVWQEPFAGAATYRVTNGQGQHVHNAVNQPAFSLLPGGYYLDGRLTATVPTPPTAVGATITRSLVAQSSETGNNHYRLQAAFAPDLSMTLTLIQRSNNVDTTLATWKHPGAYTTAATATLRLEVRGTHLQGWGWYDNAPDSDHKNPGVDGYVTGTPAPGWWGLRSNLSAGNTNPLPVTIAWDDVRMETLMSDIDVRMELRPTGEQWQVYVSQVSDPAIEQARYWSFDADEVQSCVDLSNGDYFYACTTTPQLGLVRNRRMWLRWTYDSIKAGQSEARWYTSTDGVNWDNPSWTSAALSAFQLNRGPLQVVASGEVTVARVEVRDGINGQVFASPVFEGQPAGTTELVDGQGNVWTVTGEGICGG